ncbi:MAG TPA: hypothetical protein VEW46_20065 [Pyrinomonadaceae bacterium]|nr:hypothetical protein [Pyrinomonadaceae bacterium]
MEWLEVGKGGLPPLVDIHEPERGQARLPYLELFRVYDYYIPTCDFRFLTSDLAHGTPTSYAQLDELYRAEETAVNEACFISSGWGGHWWNIH